jgi:hypothetical protein
LRPSRRRFLKGALSAPWAAALGPRGLRPLGAPLLSLGPAPEESQFPNPHIIRYDASCFTINDRDTFVFSGAFHYPRCPRALWRDRLVKFRRAGFNTIETYVFWNYHEPEEGRADLSEFEDFVKLVKEMGFWMIARPGPYVCAEWDAGGFPHWVVAKRFPLRSNHPQSLATSEHWFRQVLPVIHRHQVTMGGPIIMMQLENEYDYWKLPDFEKKEYVRALARMAWNAGIDVPLITCWTKQVRERSDADMARLMDTCNFYPRWKISQEVPPALEKLRQAEPASPLGVTELQGGWFSEFGGKLSVDQDGVNGAQLDLLSKTVIAQGVTYFSYYMGFGGTNFDWAAKRLTTTYDYAAPIREPGGLWEKYYAARGIGASLRMLGGLLARAQAPERATQSTNNNASVTERISGQSAVLFVRQDTNLEQRFKMSFQDPASPTHRAISVPRQGELVLGPREMKMLPVQVPIPGSQLRYSTAEVLGYGLNLDRHFVLLYDEPGRQAEFALATAQEPQVEGDALYQYWDADTESVTIGLRFERDEKILYVNDHLLIVALPRQRALQSWIAEFPPTVVPGAEETKPMTVPFIADVALLAETGSHHNRIWADLDLRPGERDLLVLLPPLPTHCRVDGVLTDFQYDRHWRTARLRLPTPAAPYPPIQLNEVETWVERFDPGSGDWLDTPARALEDLGPIPYGYVKYRAQFSADTGSKIAISTFADDGKKVFVNGKLAAEASNSRRQVEFALAPYAHNGANTLEIAYELFGSPNFGENLEELKGLESARSGPDLQSATPIGSWQVQRFPAAMHSAMTGRDARPTLDPDFSIGGWNRASLAQADSAPQELVPAFTWCRAAFALEKLDEAWSVPWKVTFEADRDALLYLNGKFVGRYVTIGPQKDFYLPEPYLVFEARRRNVLSVVLAYADRPQHIRTLRVGPYEEFATRRTRVEFEW